MEEEYVEIYEFFDKEKDIWRKSYAKTGEIIFEVKYSDYFAN